MFGKKDKQKDLGKKKLTLKREKVRVLSSKDLKRVAGGVTCSADGSSNHFMW